MNLKLQFDGQDSGAFQLAKEMTDHLNKMDQAAKRVTANSLNSSRGLESLEKRLLDLQNQQRRAAWERLSTEEKLVQLKKKAADLDAAAARAAKDSTLAKGIALKRSIVGAQIEMLGAGSGGKGMFAKMVEAVPGLSGMAGGAVGGMAMGAAAGFGIGAAVMFLTSALMRSAQHAIELADDLVDAAEQFRMTGGQMLQLRRAAGSKGVPLGNVMGALSRIEAARGAALQGDTSAAQLLSRYGVTEAMIRGDNSPFDLLRTVIGSLGAGGMLKEDRVPLGKLLGRRPEKIVSAVAEVRGGPTAKEEAQLSRLSRLQDLREKMGFKGENFVLDLTTAVTGISDFAGRVMASIGKFGVGNVTGPAGPGLLPLAYPTPAPLGEQPEASPLTGARTVRPTAAMADPAAFDEGIDEQMRALGSRQGGGSSGSPRISADRLARIGLFRGGVNPLAHVFERQLNVQTATLAELKSLNRALTMEQPIL